GRQPAVPRGTLGYIRPNPQGRESGKPMRTVPLRRRLLLLALAGIVPLAATSGVGLYALKEQRNEAMRAGEDVARALATAVDAALSESVSVLEALATSTVLLEGSNPEGFYERARRVMRSQPNWML